MSLRRIGKLSIRQAWGAAWSSGSEKLSAVTTAAEADTRIAVYKGA